MIVIDALSVNFGRHVALDVSDVRFPSQLCYLLGPNGAGKTTMMRTLAGENRRYSGYFMIADGGHHDAPAAPQQDRETHHHPKSPSVVGYLPQRFDLVGSATVLAQVMYAGWARGCDTRVLEETASRVLEEVGLSEKSGARTRTLSGGMRQRLGIACTLTSDPSVILLDEPTVGLDPVHRRKFMELVERLAEDRTVLISTHILTDIESSPGHVVVLSEGKATFSGTSDELAALGGGDEPDMLRGYERCLTA